MLGTKKNATQVKGVKEKSSFKLKKTLVIVLAKLSLTLLAFYIISKKIIFNPTAYLNESNANYFLLAILVALLLILVQAWRWKNILSIFSAITSLKQSFVAVWFGHLINHLIPTATAGDLLRSYTLRYANVEDGRWKWLGAFLLEKYSAATSALLIASLALFTSICHQLPLVLMAFIVLLLVGLISFPLVGVKIFSVIRIPKMQRLLGRAQQISTLLSKSFVDKRGRNAFIASFLTNLGMVITFYIIALGLGVSIKFSECLFVVPVFTLLAALPISFAGWGVRELSCVSLLGFFGVSSENAVVISVMYGLLFFLSSLPGIFVAYPFIASLRMSTKTPEGVAEVIA